MRKVQNRIVIRVRVRREECSVRTVQYQVLMMGIVSINRCRSEKCEKTEENEKSSGNSGY